MEKRANALRGVPSVDELLGRPAIVEAAKNAGRTLVTSVIREVLAEERRSLKEEPNAAVDMSRLEERILAGVEKALAPSLRRVINATGVVLHTNLGRAPLPAAALEHLVAISGRYSNLEYDIPSRARGKRDVHTANLLADSVGAEAAIVVNNNAAAVFLVLNALASGAEVVVSRGELIEIGDGFRIPDIMAASGAILREVGTTNRTRIADYERAMNEHTQLLLRVHPSNFRITGFTARPSLEEIVNLGRRFKIPVYEDLGSGCIADLAAAGVNEPVARESFIAGAGVISFSGDKLLGGPQAGIIAGKKEIVEKIRSKPLFRALRVDKLTIAALEVTLQAYRRGALDDIPALRMIRMSAEEIARRAHALLERLRPSLPSDVEIELIEGKSVIGGGSTPDQSLPTHLIAVKSRRRSVEEIESRLREPANGIPIIARIEYDRLVFDLRTVFPDEETALAESLLAAVR
ncbi:MAG TPA: L-seryl-tRNA(Sec) selenium transferase [Candidatus Acidoferrales bacterium]